MIVTVVASYPAMTDTFERLKAALADRYTIERKLGAGGMATVYLAEDLKHHRKVAVKVLRPELAAFVGAERFRKEIEVTANLRHPNILPLHDSGEAAGFFYYVMPYVEGESLRARMNREKQLPIDDVVGIATAVAIALDYAHRHDVIHRDIKPENIMLDDGQPVIADFGIALALDLSGDERLTGTGIYLGTPDYMSPEQASGETKLDARSDLYSLGCVVYEMGVGAPPFVGPTVQSVIAKRFVEPVPRMAEKRGETPRGVDEAVARAMAKAPEDRFETLAKFAEALRASQGTAPFPQPAPAAPRTISIAVLPFVNMSSDPEDEYLSDGISEQLIYALTKVPGLRVVARTSAFAFKHRQVDARTIGEQLKVDTLLDGSVRRAGNRIRVTAQLVSAADGYECWSEQFERKVGDVFAVQDEVVKAIVDTLGPTLTLPGSPPATVDPSAPTALRGGGPTELPHKPATRSFEAYELYLKGRYHWNRRTETSLQKSVDYHHRALELDPDFTLAMAGLADSYTTLGIYGTVAPHDVMPRARTMAETVLRIDDSRAEALTVLGCVRAVYDWDWEDAERDFQRAIAVNPQYPAAYQWYATNCLAPLGRLAEAREQLAKAEQLDPLAPVVRLSQGLMWYLERSFDRATQTYEALLELDPHFAMAHYFLAQVRETIGHLDEAIAGFETAVDLTDRAPEAVAGLAHAHAVAGHRGDAEGLIRALEEQSRERFVSPALIGQVYVGMGDADRAFEHLEEAHALHAPELIWINVRPMFDELTSDPRMADLRRRVGLGAVETALPSEGHGESPQRPATDE